MDSDDFFESLNARPQFVGRLILYHIPKSFNRVEFRTIRRQGYDMYARGDGGVLRVMRMEARPVPYNHMFLSWILLFDLLEKSLRPL